jgi:glycosyltransferase involved in cell wall biosynthesis
VIDSGAARLNIVWASPVVPYPPRDGGVIRIYQLLKGLAQRHSVHLLAMTHGNAAAADIAKLKGLCRSVELFTMPDLPPRWSPAWWHARWQSVRGPHHAYYQRDLHQRLDRLCDREGADVVLLETLKMANYRPTIDGRARGDNVIFSRQNYEPDLLRRMADEASDAKERALFRTSAELLARVERRVARNFRYMTAVSERDAERFRAVAPWAEVAVVPNAADTDLFRPFAAEDANADPVVAVLGTMDYPPNRDAARFFCAAIWPKVRQSCPKARLRIIGKAAATGVPELAHEPGVDIREPAGEIAAELESVTIMAVPLRIGAGTRIKILEALAAGKAVVSTSVGCEGLDLVNDKHLLVCDEPDEFAARIVGLLRDRSLRQRLAANGRQIVEERYTWPLAVDRLDAFCLHVARSTRRNAAGC